MKKDKLIEKINQAIEMEEKAIPIYSKHMNTLIDLSTIKTEKKQKLQELLKELKEDSEDHEKTLNKVKEKIRENNKDEY